MAEIERKFRLSRLPSGVKKGTGVLIRQGYLVFDEDAELRLREKNGKYFMTCKTGEGLMRQEWEVEIPFWVFGGLWFGTHWGRTIKRRYTVNGPDNLIFEFDVFEGSLNGLVILEVEFPDERTAKNFRLPEEYTAIEVTNDERYRNKYLAVFGIPD
jgi:CYTH domain-containing protein